MKYTRFQRTALMIGCALPVLLLSVLFFRGQTEVSGSENRALTRFPAFSLDSFLSGDFQDDLEKALGDQYPFGEEIKGAVLATQNRITKLESGFFQAVSPQSMRAYMEIKPGYYHYGGDQHRIVERLWEKEDYERQIIDRAAVLNTVQGVEKYIYFIRNSRAQDFNLSEEANAAVFDCIKSAYVADGIGCFQAKDYEEFAKYFYQTDHHWNHVGSYLGYQQIMALMLGDAEETLAPEKEWQFDTVFNGSYARQTKELCADEVFSAYSYPLRGMKLLLSGKKGQYGHQSLYERDRYPTDEMRNHYAYYYGGDYGEIHVDNGKSRGRNLLVLADSYSNPINLLLANHFDQTYIVDLRYFEQDMGKPFDLTGYIAEKEIDTVLMLGDIALFADAQEKEESD